MININTPSNDKLKVNSEYLKSRGSCLDIPVDEMIDVKDFAVLELKLNIESSLKKLKHYKHRLNRLENNTYFSEK